MRERPILFSGAMVRALLAGTKTQTRRVVKITHRTPGLAACLEPFDPSLARPNVAAELCPYGAPGDRLWVRETWGYFDPDGTGRDYDESATSGTGYVPELLVEGHPLREYWRRRIAYNATVKRPKYGHGPDVPQMWRPSIHMPRWASRITLELTDVRVERLQEISRDDAMAEGAPPDHPSISAISRELGYADWPRSWYAQTWDKINGKGAWDANPWVWVLSFRSLAEGA